MTLHVLPHSRFVKTQWKGFDFAMLGFIQWKDKAKVTLPPLAKAIHCHQRTSRLPHGRFANELLAILELPRTVFSFRIAIFFQNFFVTILYTVY